MGMGWVCCWFSPLLREVFSGYSGFPLSSKTNISKFQIDQVSGRRTTTLWMCYLQIIIYYLFIYEVVGIQIVSYKLAALGALSFKGSMVFPAFTHGLLGQAFCLPCSSAFLACKYNSFILLEWPKTVMQRRNTLDPLNEKKYISKW